VMCVIQDQGKTSPSNCAVPPSRPVRRIHRMGTVDRQPFAR
jgi:hypothetical protein